MKHHAGRAASAGAVAGARPLLVLLVAACLISAIAGGLVRLGIAWPSEVSPAWAGRAAVAHAALMIAAFFGTVIGIERAVAVKLRWGFAAPVGSALGGISLALGQSAAAGVLLVLAAGVFVAINIVVVRRQWAPHTLWLLGAAGALLAGNLLFASGLGADSVLAWWFAFLIITIAAERLEMTRLMPRRAGAQAALNLILCGVLAASLLSWAWRDAGGLLYGASLLSLAIWLALFDIARRTVLATGLSRYMAVCLLTGYAWLAAGGVAWAALHLGYPVRDLALHGLGLGFVFGMVMGHAPVILPAVARIKLAYGPWFYAPLAVLNASLLWRLGAGFADAGQRASGGAVNALSIALFAATVVASAILWRLGHGTSAQRAEADR